MARIKIEIDNSDGKLSDGGRALAEAVVEMLTDCDDSVEYSFHTPKQVTLQTGGHMYVNTIGAPVDDIVKKADQVRQMQRSLVKTALF